MGYTVIYDSDCGICTKLVALCSPHLSEYSWVSSLDIDSVNKLIPMNMQHKLSSSVCLHYEDKTIWGSQAILKMLGDIWVGFSAIERLFSLPILSLLSETIYMGISRNRGRISQFLRLNQCEIRSIN